MIELVFILVVRLMEQFNSDEVSYLDDDKSIGATRVDYEFPDSDFEDDFETVSIFFVMFYLIFGVENE